jgi:hypothetical protein
MRTPTQVFIKKSIPATLRFRRDGLLDFRPRDKRGWICGLDQITHLQYLSLPYRVRRRLTLIEFVTGRPLVADTPVIVSKR